MGIHEWLNNPIADYGAVLSTIALLKPYWDKRPIVRVSLEWPYENARLKDIDQRVIIIRALGLSQRTLRLSSSAGFILPNRVLLTKRKESYAKAPGLDRVSAPLRVNQPILVTNRMFADVSREGVTFERAFLMVISMEQ